jgi:hypothetical protein
MTTKKVVLLEKAWRDAYAYAWNVEDIKRHSIAVGRLGDDVRALCRELNSKLEAVRAIKSPYPY